MKAPVLFQSLAITARLVFVCGWANRHEPTEPVVIGQRLFLCKRCSRALLWDPDAARWRVA